MSIRYFETKQHGKAIEDREYVPIYQNQRGTEWVQQKADSEPPSGYDEMCDTITLDYILVQTPFALTAKRKIPPAIVRELAPVISVHVVQLPDVKRAAPGGNDLV